jgi:hypothetical protein
MHPIHIGMASDFSFISPRSFLRAIPRRNGLDHDDSCSVELYRFEDVEDSPSVELTTVLKLPPNRAGGSIRLTATTGAWVARALPALAGSFDIDNSLRIFVFHIHRTDLLHPMTFVAHGRDLQNLIDVVPRGCASRVVEWSDWIPSMTRFLGYTADFDWLRCALLHPLLSISANSVI